MRQFDWNLYKPGDRVVTRDGEKVTGIRLRCDKNDSYPIEATINGVSPLLTLKGEYWSNQEHPYDLFFVDEPLKPFNWYTYNPETDDVVTRDGGVVTDLRWSTSPCLYPISGIVNGDTFRYTFTDKGVNVITLGASKYDLFIKPKTMNKIERDPASYKDWQVGDNIINGVEKAEVIFRSGELVIYKESFDGNARGNYTCDELFRRGWRLYVPKKEEQLVHLTLQDISEGKGVGVPAHLLRIRE